ncbi:MAG TPA: 4,5-DOPA dioxygenase extradiol [Bacteroidia bacterium]|jgi:4,5-DOPA dioxygenase extradiol|nr:4,5-DOPA dioxygenase extradiol [Bacteroidia bacterium]
MERREFIRSIGLLSLTAAAMKLNAINKMVEPFGNTKPMPVLFLGHGNPMNAIEENEFTKGWQDAAKSIPRPNAILCISAHWETDGTFVTAMNKPETIHDFGGFPKPLFDFQYPAPGDPELAQQAKLGITKTIIGLNTDWGLDHGAWVVASRLYPKADIPIIQLSLNYGKSADWHYELAKELAFLRRKGVLIIGSGNVVHNLGMLNWKDDKPFDWAIDANETVKKLITAHDYKSLANYKALGSAMQLAVPSAEHYLPLMYTLALQEENENISFFNDKTVMGSISMTSLIIS